MLENIIPVSITGKAIEEIRIIMLNKNIPADYGLRVGIKAGGGCAGVSFMLGFDKVKDSDNSYKIGDIPVYIEKKHTMYIIGMQIDFIENADERGFTFVKES